MQAITGVLTREPEIRYTPQGVAMTAIEIQDETGSIVQVLCHGVLAENVALSLTAGDEITVVGEMPPAVFEATEVAVSLRDSTVAVQRNSQRWADA
jgi:single-stranded DNA-binding protein